MSLSKENSLKYFFMSIVSNSLIGIMPIYWSLFKEMDSYTVLMHRSIWTFVFLLPLVLMRLSKRKIFDFFKKESIWLLFSASFVGINWLTYIYAINNGYVIEAGLAYFVAPLMSIFLGFVLFKEKITFKQKIAVLLAFFSILYLLISKGFFPKYSLIIALSFSLYGLTGRKIQLDVSFRMIFETFFISLLFFLFYKSPKLLFNDFFEAKMSMQCLLILCGLLTVLPFYFYNTSIRFLPLSTIGILGFIVPTCIFLVGIFYFREKIDGDKFLVILFIAVSVSLYLPDLFKKPSKVNK